MSYTDLLKDIAKKNRTEKDEHKNRMLDFRTRLTKSLEEEAKKLQK